MVKCKCIDAVEFCRPLSTFEENKNQVKDKKPKL